MSSTAKNIFPQMQKTISYNSPYEPHQSIIDINRQKLKTIQAQYFQNQYQSLLTQRQYKKQHQNMEKLKDRLLIQQKKKAYQEEINRNFAKRQMERNYLSTDYRKSIDYKEQKNRYQKNLNKVVQKQVLGAPTWIRDAETERQTNIRKKMYYSKILEQHVKQQQQRKKFSQQSQQDYKQKIRKQADEILRKQAQQMQTKHRQKSMFQQRQNELLGLNTGQQNLEQSRTLLQKQRQLRNAERQLYRQGLQAQYQKQQNDKYVRRKAYSQQKTDFNPRYNPITNPIPFVYKNPNVLRMLNQ